LRKTRTIVAGALGIVTAVALTACGSSNNSSDAKATGGSTDGAGKTITVWNMQGDLSDATMKAINDEFTNQTGAQVKVETQP